MESPRAVFLAVVSGLAMLAGVLCMLIAVITGLTDNYLRAFSPTYIQIGIAGFLFSIWFAIMALFFQLRDQGPKGSQ